MSIRKEIYLLLTLLLASCSVSKFIPEGEYMLNRVDIISHNKENYAAQARSYVRQNPNSKWFSIAKVPMHIYSASGTAILEVESMEDNTVSYSGYISQIY